MNVEMAEEKDGTMKVIEWSQSHGSRAMAVGLYKVRGNGEDNFPGKDSLKANWFSMWARDLEQIYGYGECGRWREK